MYIIVILLQKQNFLKVSMVCMHLWVLLFADCGFMQNFIMYRNDPKFSDTQNICCNHSKVWTMWLYHRVMSPNDADGMANSVDPDQTAPLGAVWSGLHCLPRHICSKT